MKSDSKSPEPDLNGFLAAYYAASDDRKRAALMAAMNCLIGVFGINHDELLTGRGLAKKLGIHESTVNRWQFPFTTELGKKRYKLQDCLAYLKGDAYQLRRQVLWLQRNKKTASAA